MQIRFHPTRHKWTVTNIVGGNLFQGFQRQIVGIFPSLTAAARYVNAHKKST